MKSCMRIVVTLGLALLLQNFANGAEYFVGKQGNDANDGKTPQTSFLTIQKGVDTLQPGDTLTVGPGEYYENVKRANLGSMEVETVIRAEIPGTALLRGDTPVAEFQKVDGFQFVYAAPFEQKPQALLEHDSLRVVMEKANIEELEFDPGYFHYDADAKLLYMSRKDLLSPAGRFYTVAVNENSGLELNSPKRVTIEGLAVTGFFPGWGILLTAPESSVVRNCTCFMNVGGIVLQSTGDIGGADSGSNNLIENCTCYGNSFSGISRYVANNDVVQNCYTYKNVRDGEHFGVMHYLGMNGPMTIQNNISWGQNFNLSVKPAGQERVLNNVAMGFIRNVPRGVSHNLVFGGNEFDRGAEAAADSILMVREPAIDKDVEFADPQNLDFRLQPGSRYRGTAPDGGDRGPYPYEANIFYVSPTGNDEADGLSSKTPWRTLARGVRDLRGGDTLYLMGGSYAAVDWKNPDGSEKPISLRGRGRDPVTVTGDMAVTGGSGIIFERLSFADKLTLNESRNITINNCAFLGAAGLAAASVEGLRVTHNSFAGAPINLNNSSGVFLSGNLYANDGKPAVQLADSVDILYSDYNSYKDARNCWEAAGKVLSLIDVQKNHDLYSLVIDPQISQAGGALVLKNAIDFAGRGPNGTSLGISLEYDPAEPTMSIVGPFLHATSDTTADIEWWSDYPASYTLAWGDTPQVTNVIRNVSGPERFNTYSLTGLKPGQTYYFAIQSADASNRQTALVMPVLRPENARLSFTTAAQPAEPRTFHVAPDGDNANTGLSREQAFRTVSYAAAKVGPGDTVLISTGNYNERVRVRAAGVEGRPIIFRSAPGEKAAFAGDDLMRAFDVMNKPDVRFDGLYFRNRDFFGEGFVVRNSDRAQWTRCFDAEITVSDSSDVLVRNCVLSGGWNSLELSNCPNALVENNAFIGTILRQLVANAPTIARRNIFCECVRNKTHQTLLQLNLDNVKESDNCFYLRWPEEEKLAVNNLPLPVYRVQTNSDAFAANPMMPGVPGRVFGWQSTARKDFDQFFTANPELIMRGIGLQPSAFSDFDLETKDWPYDERWAAKITQDMSAAATLAKAGKDAEALAAYTALAANTPMCDRLKSDVLDEAAQCAWRLKQYDQAMALAAQIPLKPLAARRQMAFWVEQGKYDDLFAAYSKEVMGGVTFDDWTYPEQEDVMEELYYLRGMAFCKTGNLDAAEADLRFMNDKRQMLNYRAGEAWHGRASLHLGDFYRDYRKDDEKALAAYMEVCNRKTWSPFGIVDKPLSTGASDTLAAATKAACEILTKQGKTKEAGQLQADLAKAQADAAAALQK